MSNLYVPDGAWLVCNNGLSTKQLSVTSQTSVYMNNHLMATNGDKVGTDFGCRNKAVTFAAVLGVVSLVVAAAVFAVATGGLGLGAIAAVGAIGASGALYGGVLGMAYPCNCAICMGEWNYIKNHFLIEGHPALLDISKAYCSNGGIVTIMYSKEAAMAYAGLVRSKTNVEIGNIAAIIFISPFVIRGALTSVTGFGAKFICSLNISKFAAAAYVVETAAVGGLGALVNKGYSSGKEFLYGVAGVKRYVDGDVEKEVNKVLEPSKESMFEDEDTLQTKDSSTKKEYYSLTEDQDWMYKGKEKEGYAEHIGDRKSISITNYEDLSYSGKTNMSLRDGTYIEANSSYVANTPREKHSIRGKGQTTEVQRSERVSGVNG
nr:DUF4280 domain-containing protein [Prevotella sp.]